MAVTRPSKTTFRRRRYRPRRINRTRRRINRRRRNRSDIRNGVLMYRSPHQNPFPQVYMAKFRSKVAGVFTVAGANPVGFNSLQSNRVYVRLNTLLTSPWSNFGATQGLTGAPTFNTLLPVGVNELVTSGMYQSYQVLGAKLSFQLLPSPSTTNDTCMVALTATRGQTVHPAAFNNAIDQPWSKYKIFKGTTGERPVSLYVPFSKFLGIKKSVFNNDDTGQWSASVTADPPQVFYCICNINMADGLAPGQPIPFEVELTSYIKFYMQTDPNLG